MFGNRIQELLADGAASAIIATAAHDANEDFIEELEHAVRCLDDALEACLRKLVEKAA